MIDVACEGTGLCHLMESGFWGLRTNLTAYTIVTFPSSVLKNHGGGVVRWWWSFPAGKGLVACQIIILSSCTSFWLVSGHLLLQQQLHTIQLRDHE